MTAPFERLLVVDLSVRVSRTFAARLFGDFGAHVVLVEAPGGHPLRNEPPFLDDQPGVDRGVLHAYVNWNKRTLLVASTPAEIAGLLAYADVVITNDSPLGAAGCSALPSRFDTW